MYTPCFSDFFSIITFLFCFLIPVYFDNIKLFLHTVSFTLSSCHSSLCVCVTTINVSIPESIINLTEAVSVITLVYDPP